MNGGGFGGGRRKMAAPPPSRSRDRDEDLLLFREMHRSDKARVVSLLQPVSDEFEANGNYPLYGMASRKKGPAYGFTAASESEKNDYDWLKTPPATPLFPSLEMESKNAPELAVQRELPILQPPLSRFAGNSEEATRATSKNTAARPKSPNPKPMFPGRSVTPSGRPSISMSDHRKNIKSAPLIVNPKLNQLSSSTGDLNLIIKRSNPAASVAKPMSQKESHLNFLAANLSKSMQGTNSSAKTTPKSRGVSPLVRSTIPAQIPGFSDETPSNLKTDRSASRGRATTHNNIHTTTSTTASAPQKPEYSTMIARRQACSPSVTRGRKVAPKQDITASEENHNNNVTTPRGGKFQAGNGGQVFGSRMVDKLMNARKTSGEEKEAKSKLNSSLNEGSGFGRATSKSSLDMAAKHMEVKRDSVHTRQLGVAAGRKSVSVSNTTNSKSSGGSHRTL